MTGLKYLGCRVRSPVRWSLVKSCMKFIRRGREEMVLMHVLGVFFSSRRRHTRCGRDWGSDVCSSDLAACRELLVTSPAELCQDLVQNPVTPLPVSMRIGSILGLVWGTLTSSPPRLIPLPMALEWAEDRKSVV